jgi:hypothetical protein
MTLCEVNLMHREEAANAAFLLHKKGESRGGGIE